MLSRSDGKHFFFVFIFILARENDIQLLFVETPKYERLVSDTREGSYTELLKEMTEWAEEQDAYYLLAEDFDFDHSDGENFQDLIHLSGKGRKAYCEVLAKHIKAANF